MKVKPRRAGKKNNRAVRNVEIRGDFIRLDALLKFSGIAATGGEAKELILDGRVTVNGNIVMQRGKKIKPGDVVVFMATTLTVHTAESEAGHTEHDE